MCSCHYSCFCGVRSRSGRDLRCGQIGSERHRNCRNNNKKKEEKEKGGKETKKEEEEEEEEEEKKKKEKHVNSANTVKLSALYKISFKN